MAIVRFNDSRFSDVDRWDHYFRSIWDRNEEDLTGCWCPSVDIYEDESAFTLNVELSGMEKSDVQINAENDVLTISGERKSIDDDKRANYHRVERCYGSFSRSFTMGQAVNQDGINAKMENGMLVITLPKKEESRPRQIEVKVK